jgi:hypothetical protein
MRLPHQKGRWLIRESGFFWPTAPLPKIKNWPKIGLSTTSYDPKKQKFRKHPRQQIYYLEAVENVSINF